MNTSKKYVARDAARVVSPKYAHSFGRVSNLEEHVSPDWWRHIFNSLYLKTDGDVINDLSITRKEVDLFSQILQLSPEDRILDVCCGQGRHALELARRGFKHVEGVDLSHYLIQRARNSACKENLPVEFKECDARELPYPPSTFDAAMVAGNSFGYFANAEDDLKVLTELNRVLKPQGRLLLDITDGEYIKTHFEPRSWEWVGRKYFVCRERCLSSDKQRLITRELIFHVNKGVLADQFYAVRLYTRDSLTELLLYANFTLPTFYNETITDSQQHQDLGMMARRLIVATMTNK